MTRVDKQKEESGNHDSYIGHSSAKNIIKFLDFWTSGLLEHFLVTSGLLKVFPEAQKAPEVQKSRRLMKFLADEALCTMAMILTMATTTAMTTTTAATALGVVSPARHVVIIVL